MGKLSKQTAGLFFSLIINLFSKIIGFVREVLISSQFGSGKLTDTFFTLQQIPQAVGNYIQGAFNLSFIPNYHEAERKGVSGSFLKYTYFRLLVLGIVLTLVYLIVSRYIHRDSELSLEFSYIFTFSIVPFIVIGITYGVLNARERYIQANLYVVIYPVLMLIFILVLPLLNVSNEITLPLSYTLGLVLSSLIGYLIYQKSFRLDESSINGDHDIKVLIKKFKASLAHSTIENIGFNLNAIFTVFVLSHLDMEGIVSSNSYASRISMLFLSGLIGPIMQVVQGYFSKNKVSLNEVRKITLLFTLLVVLVTIGMAYFRSEVVSLVYERGKFTSADTASTSNFLLPYMCYFLVLAMNQYFARLLYAQFRSKNYVYVMLVLYTISNVLKPIMVMNFTPAAVIWVMVICEGMGVPYFYYLTNVRPWKES